MLSDLSLGLSDGAKLQSLDVLQSASADDASMELNLQSVTAGPLGFVVNSLEECVRAQGPPVDPGASHVLSNSPALRAHALSMRFEGGLQKVYVAIGSTYRYYSRVYDVCR
jgi:hypothetical protein